MRRVPSLAAVLAALGIGFAASAGASGGTTVLAADPHADVAQVAPTGFTHADHTDVACYTCHENSAGHGALTVTTIEDCRGCHHAPERAAPCARCHETAPDGRFDVTRAVTFSVPASDPRRSLGFVHDEHATLECARCHTAGVALAVPADLDCASCHAEHHTVESDCASCHAPVHAAAHPPAEVHVTCSGSACHLEVPFETVPRTRAFCLGCHRDKSQHEAPTDCARCHILPAPRAQR